MIFRGRPEVKTFYNGIPCEVVRKALDYHVFSIFLYICPREFFFQKIKVKTISEKSPNGEINKLCLPFGPGKIFNLISFRID